MTITNETPATMTTTKGTHEGTIESCVAWQREQQAEFASLVVGETTTQIDHIDYGTDDLDDDVWATIAAIYADHRDDLPNDETVVVMRGNLLSDAAVSDAGLDRYLRILRAALPVGTTVRVENAEGPTPGPTIDERIARICERAWERWSATLSDDDTASPIETVRCACGEWSGERCEWSGPHSETVVVEYMPEQHRASHKAAGNCGSYPNNGACRIRVNDECADRMLEIDGDWCRIVSATK